MRYDCLPWEKESLKLNSFRKDGVGGDSITGTTKIDHPISVALPLNGLNPCWAPCSSLQRKTAGLQVMIPLLFSGP